MSYRNYAKQLRHFNVEKAADNPLNLERAIETKKGGRNVKKKRKSSKKAVPTKGY